MTNTTTGTKSAEDLLWLKHWAAQKFSWKGLDKQKSWRRKDAGSLQEFLRKAARGATDAELEADGILVDCGRRGLYHVLFIPEEWALGKGAVCDPDYLKAQKQKCWAKLHADVIVNEHFEGTISGVHMPPEVEQRMAASYKASFRWVRFKSALRQIPKHGQRSFSNCLFQHAVALKGPATASPPPASLRFHECHMISEVTLDDVTDLADIHFDTCKLAKFITIRGSTLSRVRFDQCSIAGMRLANTNVSAELAVATSDIHGSLEFANCRFSGQLLFIETAFGESIDLLSCDFQGRVTFADTHWPPVGHFSASASGSKFEATVTFGGNTPPPVQLFQDAEFTSKVAFRGFSARQSRMAFWSELTSLSCTEASLVDPRRHAGSIEAGSRTLRQIAEAAGDVHGEQLWHRAEIIARRRRGEASVAERVFSKLYGVVADYGISIARPFVALLLSICAFAIVYGWLGGGAWAGAAIDWKTIEEGLGYSLNRTIPIGVFSDDTNLWRKGLIGSAGELSNIAIRTIATVQSIISAVLIYLGIMAIRRKFRIA